MKYMNILNPRALAQSPLPPLFITILHDLGHAGLGNADLNDLDKPIETVIYASSRLKIGDTLKFYWHTTLITQFPLDASHTNRPLRIDVFPPDILNGPTNAQVYYSITSTDGIEVPSDIVEVLVKTSTPGNPDPVISTPVTNENLGKPQNVPPTLDAAAAARGLGVTIPAWENMAAGDVLTLYWRGRAYALKQPALLESQVNKPQLVSVPGDVIIAAGSGVAVEVYYEVRDLVNNWSLYSPATLTSVTLG